MVDFNQAKNFLDQHDEQIDQAVDKAQQFTGGRDTTAPDEQPPPPPA
jgi:hypothetical protein